MREKNKSIIVPAIWLVAAFLHAIIIDANINRINIIYIPLVILSTLGLQAAFEKIGGLSYVIIMACILAFTAFAGYYFNDYNKDAQWMFFGGFDKAVKCASEYTGYADGTVYMSSRVAAPYILTIFTQRIPPTVYATNDGTHYVTGITNDITPKSGDAFIIKYDDEIPIYLDTISCNVHEMEYYLVYMVR